VTLPAALAAWIALHPYLVAFGWFAYSWLEWWLGRTPSTPVSSFWGGVFGLAHAIRMKLTGQPAKEIIMGSGSNTVSVNVNKATADILSLLNDIVSKIAAGAKPQDVAAAELGQLLAVFNEVGSLPADAKADPEAVENAVALGLIQLGKTLRTTILTPKAPAPGK